MDPEQSRPRTYLLGRRFRLRPNEDTMGVDVIDRDSFAIPTDPNEEPIITIGDMATALWRGVTTRQPGGLIMDKLRRAQAVLGTLCHSWVANWRVSRNFYGKDLQYPAMFHDQNFVWRGPRAGQYQIAYQDPSPDPKWRMKQIIEFTDETDVNRIFQISGSNMTWIWRNTRQGSANFRVHNLPNGIVTMVPEPLW